tara:strand:+ start:225 stop:422 length:198 start_codon:yes stop_codon:yes gene_type:complete
MKKLQALKLINQIQNIRKKNNINWMDMLRLAFKHDPKNASKIMLSIYREDQRVSKIVKKLVKITK